MKASASCTQVPLAERRRYSRIRLSGRYAYAFAMCENPVSSGYSGSKQDMCGLMAKEDSRPRGWTVCADSDDQAGRFKTRGYTGIGWIDLSSLHSQDRIWERPKKGNPRDESAVMSLFKTR